jgi:glycosyltransferase involved in cell wall biosynthesis
VPHPSSRILFILKRRSLGDYPSSPNTTDSYSVDRASGLLNSVRFIVEMLQSANIECELVQVVDNNCIDREITRYKPTHVIIEALWVVPEKFEILTQLHPNVEWLIRIHSEIPFIANEGVAIDWITRSVAYPKVGVAANSIPALIDVRHILRSGNPEWSEKTLDAKIVYLPNFYPHKRIRDRHEQGEWTTPEGWDKDALNVCCFGAIRPLKNNLLQAVAAIRYADEIGVKMNFHVNGGRNEQGGDNAMKNLKALFYATPHTLVTHPWASHDEFLSILRGMNLSLCVSLSETFCIVAADSIALGVPTVVSSEIEWASAFATAQTTDSGSVVNAIKRVMHPWLRSFLKFHNRQGLQEHCETTKYVWVEYFVGC